MSLMDLAAVAARSSRIRPLAAFLVAVIWLAVGCAPLAQPGQPGAAPLGAGQVATRRVTILYTGYGRGAVEPVVHAAGCT